MTLISLILFYVFTFNFISFDRAFPTEKRTSIHYFTLTIQLIFSFISFAVFIYLVLENMNLLGIMFQ